MMTINIDAFRTVLETTLPMCCAVLFCFVVFVVSCCLFVCCCLLVLASKEGESGLVHHPEFLKQGLLYVQDVAKKGRKKNSTLNF